MASDDPTDLPAVLHVAPAPIPDTVFVAAGAGAVVREGERVAPCSLVVGVPARLARALPEGTYDEHCRWARKYVDLARAHRAAAGTIGR